VLFFVARRFKAAPALRESLIQARGLACGYRSIGALSGVDREGLSFLTPATDFENGEDSEVEEDPLPDELKEDDSSDEPKA